jgi:hypothetical protein
MEIVDFSVDRAKAVTRFGSVGFAAAAVVRADALGVTALHLAAGGEIGNHPAVVDQLLLVASGRGEVCGPDGVWHAISAGQGALWAAGEPHTTRAHEPMVAIAVELPDLRLSVVGYDGS